LEQGDLVASCFDAGRPVLIVSASDECSQGLKLAPYFFSGLLPFFADLCSCLIGLCCRMSVNPGSKALTPSLKHLCLQLVAPGFQA